MSRTLERHHCNRCGRETDWSTGRTRAVCAGCRTQFPCVGCAHFDCRVARGEAKACLDCRVVDGHLPTCRLYEKPVDVGAAGVVILESSGDETVSTGGTEGPGTRAAAPEAAIPTGKPEKRTTTESASRR